jgi:hypothetical protein
VQTPAQKIRPQTNLTYQKKQTTRGNLQRSKKACKMPLLQAFLLLCRFIFSDPAVLTEDELSSQPPINQYLNKVRKSSPTIYPKIKPL